MGGEDSVKDKVSGGQTCKSEEMKEEGDEEMNAVREARVTKPEQLTLLAKVEHFSFIYSPSLPLLTPVIFLLTLLN